MKEARRDGFITIVSGLPRTGTSMMMKMLEAGGMSVVVDNVRQADIDNPGGYYELESVKKIKEDVSWLTGTEGKAFKMVSMLLYELPPGMRYKIIFMERAMAEVLASQEKMLKRRGEAAAAGDDPDKMRRLYEKHLGEVKDWLARQKNMDVLYVSYNRVMEDSLGSAEAVGRFLGGGQDARKMAGVIDEVLYRNRAKDLAQSPVAQLEEKVARSLAFIREELGKPGSRAVAFGGGKDSVVLLHLVRRAAGSGLSLPVLCLDPPGEYPALYYFIEKMRKLWGLDMLRVKRPTPHDGAASAPWQEICPGLSGLVTAASARGFARVFTGLRADEEGVAGELEAVLECGPVALLNPMLEFTGPDVWEYIREHRLPTCSIYGAAGRAVQDAPEVERVRSSLKALGYL